MEGTARHGYWYGENLIPGAAFTLATCRCSECRKESLRLDIDKPYEFCPYCGAKMKQQRVRD